MCPAQQDVQVMYDAGTSGRKFRVVEQHVHGDAHVTTTQITIPVSVALSLVVSLEELSEQLHHKVKDAFGLFPLVL